MALKSCLFLLILLFWRESCGADMLPLSSHHQETFALDDVKGRDVIPPAHAEDRRGRLRRGTGWNAELMGGDEDDEFTPNRPSPATAAPPDEKDFKVIDLSNEKKNAKGKTQDISTLKWLVALPIGLVAVFMITYYCYKNWCQNEGQILQKLTCGFCCGISRDKLVAEYMPGATIENGKVVFKELTDEEIVICAEAVMEGMEVEEPKRKPKRGKKR